MSGDRTAFFRTIRFRLTAWYALILFVLILILGAALASLLERDLRQDVDSRLQVAAQEMIDQFGVSSNFGDTRVFIPPSDAFTSPGLLIQVVDNDGEIHFSTEILGDRRLPTVPTGNEKGPRFDTSRLDSVPIRSMTYPITLRNGRVLGAVNVAEPLRQLNATLRDLRRRFLLTALAGAGLSAVAGWFLAGRSLKPMDKMVSTARNIASPGSIRLDQRIEVPRTKDELARLATTFNGLLDQIEIAFDTQRQFVADASHELRTPLTAIRGNVDLLGRQLERDDSKTSEVNRTLSDLSRESGRMSRLIDDLLTLARSETPGGLPLSCEEINLAEIARDAVRTVLASDSELNVAIEGVDRAVVEGDRDRLEQVMLILLDNAVRHSPEHGAIRLNLSLAATTAGFEVSDSGPGIPEADLAKVFDRFYRADESRSRSRGGTGLGLAIARAIVTAHAGEIRVSSVVGVGTTIMVSLPLQGGCHNDQST